MHQQHPIATWSTRKDYWEGGAGGHLRALGRVLGDLTDLGYDTRWATVRASDIGAPHHRARVFLIAYPHRNVGGPWSGINSRREAPIRALASSGSEYGSGTANENTPHTDCFGLEKGHLLGRGNEKEVTVVDGSGEAFPHPSDNGYERAWSTREGGLGSSDCHNRDVEWGEYAPAVRRWERIVGPAPAPTEPNSKGKPRLNAAFAEWMMGLPTGHVISPEIGLTRSQQLKAIGNGVVPQQATAALKVLLGMDYAAS